MRKDRTERGEDDRNERSQTTDPGDNHASGGPITGDAYAAPAGGQDDRDTPPDHQAVGVPVRESRQHNPINGSGGSRRTIAPSKVRGSNP